MRFRRRTIRFPILFALVVGGCRSGGDVEGLIRENQQREERALHLQVELDRCCRELRATQEMLAAKEQRTTSDSTRRGATDDGSPSDTSKPPKVDLGPPGDRREPTPLEPAPKYDPTKPGATGTGSDAAVGPDLGQMHSVAARRGDQRVAAITLNQQLTTGLDADDARPGDEGLIVVIEPRSALGDALRVPGEVTVLAYDAGLLRQYGSQGAKRQLAHVGTWLFTRADAETWFDDDQPRLRFELPWPAAGGPKSKDLHVVVRYKTTDGRLLEAQSPVAIQLSGQRAKFAPTAPPTTAPLGGRSSGTAARTGVAPGEFSAIKKTPEAPTAEVSRAPPKLPQRAQVLPADVSDAPAGAQVPSRQRPEWTPHR
jgi:hypothetical protein